MEYLKTYYSLEKHLEETVRFNPQFEILNAIWKLNKKNLSSALSNINQYFPHYSLHERSHSNTIINNIESFLGEERIKKLSPTDTWLLLMATFTHDLGMVVFQEIVEKEWSSQDFQLFLKEISDWDDDAMKSSGELLLKLHYLSENQKIDDPKWLASLSPVTIKNSVTLTVAEYMRRIHHKRSSDILKGVDDAFFKVAKSFYSDQIPGRLMTVLAEVAYLHGVEFYEIFKRLDFEANGISNDKIHPRFIAAMLRLGDLLDIDDSRFNIFTEQVFHLPKSSSLHKQKHSSVKHFLVTPEAIEITSDCPSESVYRLARSWYDWLEDEVEKQSKEWSNLVPKNLGGSAPRIPKGKVKVFFNGARANEELLNLRFQVSNDKIFEILEGASIYEKAEFTFVRELVQNALDASKIQLWSEIEKGRYDFAFRMAWKEPYLTHEEILGRIEFPYDIPDLIMKSFQIKLTIKWKDEQKKAIDFIVEDEGTGISDPDLIRMTAKVGESRKENGENQEMVKRMPFWLKPTGAFGIGLQSLFIVTDYFTIQTKANGEESKEIIFRSAKKGKYSSISSTKPSMNRGTKVIVSIPEDKFSDVFGTTFDMNIVWNYDYFSDEYGSIYIPKIRAYINEVLKDIPQLDIDFFGKKIGVERLEIENKPSDVAFSDDHLISCRLILEQGELYFEFFEKEIGSQFFLHFPSDASIDIEGKWTSYKTIYYVRDIPVESRTIQYYKLFYSRLVWNFMSPESDKILSLTREKFISKKKQELQNKFLKQVVPTAVQLAEKLLFQKREQVLAAFQDSPDRLALAYFKFLLTKSINKIKGTPIDFKLLGDFFLPIELVSRTSDVNLKMKDFFSIEKAFVPVSSFVLSNEEIVRKNKAEILETHFSQGSENSMVIWNSQFFSQFLIEDFKIIEVCFHDKGYVLVLQKSDSVEESVKIKSGKDIYLKYMLKSPNNSNRSWFYAAEKYADKLSVQNTYKTGFERFPFLSNCSIISPFKDVEGFKGLRSQILEVSGEMDVEKIKKALTNEIIRKHVSQTLIDWIIERHPSQNGSKLTEEMVVQGYRELIADMILSIKMEDDNKSLG